MVCFDPSSPEDAYTMAAEAMETSARLHRPVLLRPTTRICHAYATVTIKDALERSKPAGWTADNGKWVIFPKLSYNAHLRIVDEEEKMAADAADDASVISGDAKAVLGIAAGGVSWAYLKEALESNVNYQKSKVKLLKVNRYPFNEALAKKFLSGLDKALVFEELDPVIEDALVAVCGREHLNVSILGKRSRTAPRAGENTVAEVRRIVDTFLSPEAAQAAGDANTREQEGAGAATMPALPPRPPILCAGCPHRASFFAVKQGLAELKLPAAYCGDIGCYTLGNAAPMNTTDTCLCMGAGISQAAGIHRVDPSNVNVAFIGDSTFFHAGIPGIVNAVYNQADILVVVLDNSTTAMTGGQVHPGMGRTLLGQQVPKVSIEALCRAAGAAAVERLNTFDYTQALAAVKRLAVMKGVRVLILEGPCIQINKNKTNCKVDVEKCTGCGLCEKKLGCPAITMEMFDSKQKAVIDPGLCTGCGLCTYVCPAEAIK
jgi:indolepyruvate ferredoxin oxidoreductase alpha subunit